MQKAAWLTKVIVALVLAVLAAVVVACLSAGTASPPAGRWDRPAGRAARRRAVVLRLRRVRPHRHTRRGGPRPAPHHPTRGADRLGCTLVVYVAVAISVLLVLGPQRLASAVDPLAEAVRAAGVARTGPRSSAWGAAIAALGSLLALLLGVSRTTFAMARDRHLPRVLAVVHPRTGVPHRAELAVGAVAALLAATVDLRAAIGFSSFGVLAYYAIANASALNLTPREVWLSRCVPVFGILGCVLLAGALPIGSVLAGSAILGLGAVVYRLTASRVT
uniref:APC family permease n=1 Tax=Kutzneria viridogrisea TaxID=47990 RepID=UPI00296F754D